MEIPRSWGGVCSLPWYVGGSQVLGVACVVITGVWMGHFYGGYAWNGSGQQFNVHPLCMVLGMVFLYGDGVLVYRVFRNESKRSVKILHALIHMMALVISIVGLVAVFDYHNKANIPNMYSLHSWCGMLTFVLYFLQWLLGLGLFLFPWASTVLRSWYLPLHVFFGLVLLAMAVGSSLMGITEKLLFSQSSSSSSTLAPEAALANVLGLLLVCFAVLVGFVVTKEEFRRPPNPEEEALSVHFNTLNDGSGPSSP
ncbi:transmembrane ascorbate-dependent reductase CYB561 [Astyanax mexicanus]|uniref:transmembrane ascorbate-dependent reductase CYB561 n=1 Tax=Astyanax mexicanus TaxID=7994 RepID=UPI0020CAA3AD|nr:transmembrane ascorbate-dependent reductase CYB561 [Astyanax mexicanus]XP_022523807.2 transmembrane ascorbate-dependent reductase CYB561 [Astyanax mexicanus]XP_022523808.2 transmembrane ascorbate-dependent reductase CYB561 [Astyanax mexicanus]